MPVPVLPAAKHRRSTGPPDRAIQITQHCDEAAAAKAAWSMQAAGAGRQNHQDGPQHGDIILTTLANARPCERTTNRSPACAVRRAQRRRLSQAPSSRPAPRVYRVSGEQRARGDDVRTCTPFLQGQRGDTKREGRTNAGASALWGPHPHQPALGRGGERGVGARALWGSELGREEQTSRNDLDGRDGRDDQQRAGGMSTRGDYTYKAAAGGPGPGACADGRGERKPPSPGGALARPGRRACCTRKGEAARQCVKAASQ
jgi:hypothetical protein